MHEFLSPAKLKYTYCRWCDKRSPYICFRCGYCYSCHPLVENLEKRRIYANPGTTSPIDIESQGLSG